MTQANQEQSHAEEFVPAITWLNMSGDVTITWDESNRAAIEAMVEKKMKEGFSFFILKPRSLKVLGNKKVALTDPRQLKDAVGVVITDEQAAKMQNGILPSAGGQPVERVGDEDVRNAVTKGEAQMARSSSNVVSLDTVRRARNAKDVVANQSVAVRPVVGG